ncbi:hypothetical protein BD289DRAFT_377387 [Coniella lustricola]|uniref:Methyltransferase n=1 Tax=Coniella lustricola TaxID=2025994 RepID=A0A2T2ZVJ4_9PEZI|nr:hypothetical protein BD289DRAFT_377387 [Coniella lustricola]
MTTSTFNYIDPAATAPWSKVDADVTSFTRVQRKRSVTNIREASSTGAQFGVDITGFDVHHAPSTAIADPSIFFSPDDTQVRSQYYPEVEALLRAKLGPRVKKIFIFDHTVRRHDPSSPRQPVQQVHVDQTPKAAETRVRRHLPAEEVDDLLQKRFQLINVWRPIGHAASDYPLAVIDWRTTKPEDLFKVDLLYPTRNRDIGDGNDDRGKEVLPDPAKALDTSGYEAKGETYAIAPNPEHKLYYMKDMTPDEAMFIKCFDSWGQGQPKGREGLAALTPHTAFVDPDTPKDVKGRQSIEVRCLIFYDE